MNNNFRAKLPDRLSICECYSFFETPIRAELCPACLLCAAAKSCRVVGRWRAGAFAQTDFSRWRRMAACGQAEPGIRFRAWIVCRRSAARRLGSIVSSTVTPSGSMPSLRACLVARNQDVLARRQSVIDERVCGIQHCQRHAMSPCDVVQRVAFTHDIHFVRFHR